MSKHDEWLKRSFPVPLFNDKAIWESDVVEYLAKLDAEYAQLLQIIRITKAMGFYVITDESGATHRAVAKAVEQALREKDNEKT